jgi:hypothetical protein
MQRNSIYDKALLQEEALKSKKDGRITDTLGQFIIDISEYIVQAHLSIGDNHALRQYMIDGAVMRVCEEFLDRFDPEFKGGSSAATLIYSLVKGDMLNKMKATKWKDTQGQNVNSWFYYVDAEGKKVKALSKALYDEGISRNL